MLETFGLLTSSLCENRPVDKVVFVNSSPVRSEEKTEDDKREKISTDTEPEDEKGPNYASEFLKGIDPSEFLEDLESEQTTSQRHLSQRQRQAQAGLSFF